MKIIDWDSPEFAGFDAVQRLEALAASAAQLAYENGDGVVPEQVDEISEGAEFVIPLLIPEELESGDGRKMEKGALSTRNLPIPLLWQPATGNGHDNSYIVARIDSIEEVETGLGNARGVFDTGPYGREAERLVRAKMLRGVSADLDMFEATIDENGDEMSEDFDPSTIKNEKMNVKRARVMAATLVAKPAFQECTIELVSEDDMNDQIPVQDGVYEDVPTGEGSAEFALSAIIASAAPVNPPSAWFANQELSGPTPITVTDDGHVFGHIATWETDHVAYATNVKPPRSRSNYAYFRTGIVRTIEGEDVAVGQLTLAGGHAPLDANAQSAVKHYDDTNSAVADVNAGEDQFGIWVSGALRPSVTPEQVRVFRASAPSGDWRPINGRLELVAVCQVNVPGFPVARALMASGQVMSLVAAGAATLHKMKDSRTDELASRVDRVERELIERRKLELAARISPLKEARAAKLREAAALATKRMAPYLERRAELAAQREAAAKRLSEFKLNVVPDWKEESHPRDDEGKFREVLLRLGDIADKPDAPEGVAHAKETLQKAADLDEQGDKEGAKAAADEAKAEIETAASGGDSPVANELKDVAKAITDASGDAAGDVVQDVTEGDFPADDGKDEAPGVESGDIDALLADDIPDFVKDFIDDMIDELGEGVDPQSILSRMEGKVKHWVEGKGFQSPEQMAKLIEKLLARPIQPDIGQ